MIDYYDNVVWTEQCLKHKLETHFLKWLSHDKPQHDQTASVMDNYFELMANDRVFKASGFGPKSDRA